MFFRKAVYNELEKNVNAVQVVYTSKLVRKTEYNAKIKYIKDKFLNYFVYISTSELKNAKLRTKDDIANFGKKANFWWKTKNSFDGVTSSKKKLLKTENKPTDLTKKFQKIQKKKKKKKKYFTGNESN